MNIQQILLIAQIALSSAKSVPQIDPQILGYIQTALNAISAATEAVQQAQQGVDPSALKPIEEVP